MHVRQVDEIDAFRVKDGAPCTLFANDNSRAAEGGSTAFTLIGAVRQPQ
jgi:hypothetical protein